MACKPRLMVLQSPMIGLQNVMNGMQKPLNDVQIVIDGVTKADNRPANRT